MTNFNFSTIEDFKKTNFGTYLLDIVKVLGLPLPIIKGRHVKNFQKEDLWAIKVYLPGCESEPPIEDIVLKFVHDNQEKGINIAMQELIGRLCGRHTPELKMHYSYSFGRRDEG